MDPLFSPVRLGEISLAHRVVMAPLTRLRVNRPGKAPDALNALYYGQRASQGGLIITEATDTSPHAAGYPGSPGIYTAAQIAGWRLVTEAVHAKGGLIFCQIWHTGRVSHPSLQPDGLAPFAPSAIAAPGMHMDRDGQPAPFPVPRELDADHIAAIVADFAAATAAAHQAGFDGVEVHGANSYLIDQFLQTASNQRTDRYGGSIENRARFLLEVVDAVAAVRGGGRVGVRLSPFGKTNGMADADGAAMWDHVVAQLGLRSLAYLHLVEPRADQRSDVNALDPQAPDAAERFKPIFGGPIIAAGGFEPGTAREAIASRRADAIAFGRSFIANPDLPERIRTNAAFNAYDRTTFYGGDARGYVDYPFL
ncbi:alkene reductase [Erythrobacter sp.]|uniref:alkene reductase n=1 Tax=Erythrobacter sp. TaxID=1042 RepID=UPI00311F84D5